MSLFPLTESETRASFGVGSLAAAAEVGLFACSTSPAS